MHLGVGSKFARVAMAVVTTVSITIVACSGPTPPPPAGGEGPIFQIGSPQDGGLTAGTFFLSAQPLDASAVARVDFEVDGVPVGSDSDGTDGFRVALSAGDYTAGAIELQATAVGTNGRSRTRTITVENVPAPPSSTTVGSDGAVLATARGSTLGIRPGDAVGANVSFAERTTAEVLAATGVDYAGLGVTFLGAQEIDSDMPIEEPLMVSSADFASFVQAGQAIVNYMIAPDADGDGVGELVVVNTASVAGDDVISDPIPVPQLGEAVVTGGSGSALFSPLQEGIAGAPGDVIELETSGFNPVSYQSNRVVWESLVDGTLVESFAAASSDDPQTVHFVVPVLPAGPAEVTLFSPTAGGILGPIDVTVGAAAPLSGSADAIIDDYMAKGIALLEGLPTDGLGSVVAKAEALQALAKARQSFGVLIDFLETNPAPEIEALLDDFALVIQGAPDPTAARTGISSQELTEAEDNKILAFLAVWAFGGSLVGIGAALAAGTVVAPYMVGFAAGMALFGAFLGVYRVGEKFRPGCPSVVSDPGAALGITGMGSAPAAGGSGCGSALGELFSSSLRGQQVEAPTAVVKIFVGGSPLPFTGFTDEAGYFFIPIIPAGEPFTAVATDTTTNESRTFEGVGPAVGDSVYMVFDFASDEGALPAFPLGSNETYPLTPTDTVFSAFTASAGQLVGVGAQGDAAFTGSFDVEIVGPLGDPVDLTPGSSTLSSSEFYRESRVTTLPVAGSYTLSVSSDGGTGSATVGVVVIDPPTPIDIATSPATTTGEQTVLGDRHFFSFDAVAGDLHKFSLTLPAGSEFNAWLELYGPDPDPFYDGDDLLSPTVSVTATTSTGGVSVSNPFVVPATGSYVIEIERGNSSTPSVSSLGAWEFAVHTPDPPTAIALGDPVSGSVGVPGEMDLYTFTGAAGQSIDVSTANVDLEVQPVNMSLTAPDGTVLFDKPLFPDPGNVVLPEAGTYTLLVGSDADDGTGAYEFTVANLP